MKYPKSFEKLMLSFKDLPGIGEKTAERLVFTLIDFEPKKIEVFAQSLLDVNLKLKRCSKCNHIAENKICEICSDNTRNNKIICVVEDSRNVFLFEKNGLFNGVYHVLGGLISPFEGINPTDINIKSLLNRVKEEKIEEIIIALKPTIEGETTSLYILKMLEGMRVIVSKIAHGIPMGTDMSYLDPLTLETALNDRKKIS